MATVRELVTRWGFKVDDRPLRRIDTRVSKLKASLRSLNSIGIRVGAGFAAISTGIGLLLREAGEFEQIEIAFETLTQSQEKARKLTEELVMFAQKTPFELKGVFNSTKQLLAYGIEAENMIDTLTALGNIAAGVGKDKLPQLTLAFGQVRTAGRLRGQEVRQFTEAGVPIAEAIAEQMGVAKEQVQDMVSRGEVGFEVVNAALQRLANGTGRFTGLMEKQSRTLLGLFSNLKDAVQVLAISVGGALVPEAKEYLRIAIAWISANKELIQRKTTRFMALLVDGLKQLVKVGMFVLRILKAVTNALGGFENAVKLATFAVSALVGVRVVQFLGNVGLVALSAAKNLLVFTAQTRTAALAVFSLKAIALALPIAIGAAVAALFLLIEDLVVYMQGGDSLIGSLVENFDKAAPAFLEALDRFGNKAIEKVQEVTNKILNFLQAEEFAPQRKKIADALLAAFDVAIVGSVALAKIGWAIGSVIADGIFDAIAERSPMLATLVGISSKRQRKKRFEKTKFDEDTANAIKFIEKFGLEDVQKSQAFAPEVLTRAQALIKKGVDPDKLTNVRRDVLGGRLEKMGSPGQMIRGPIPGMQNNSFVTNVKIDGSDLDEKALERAISKGVNEAQEKTARDMQQQGGASISE